MSVQSAQAFKAYMEQKEMSVSFLDDEEKVARVGFHLDGTTIEVLVFFGDDDKDVSFVGRGFVNIPADKQGIVYRLCNECNNRFRWVKFVWDEGHESLTVQADAVIEPQTCAEECYEIIGRMCSIVNEAYPFFMKTLWA